ncbi:unnamed protein product [Debaryomyces tyrocola]|nr:unnamed protein product [Debaryomyces tyrocola]
MSGWNRLIRFEANDGKIYRGDAIVSDSDYDIGKQFAEGKTIKARVVIGSNIFTDAKVTDEVLEVKKLLGPLTAEDVPVVKCIGMNYKEHLMGIIEPPPYPQLFYKPRTSVADQNEDIPIPLFAQNTCDYEGELCVVIGKTGKNINEEDALSYVAGYVSGNDLSARDWQYFPEYAGKVPQLGFSKSFDRYAPLGPAIVSSKIIKDPHALQLQTRINGDLRQNCGTDDLLFNISRIIAFISQETTLEQGTVIMTGTPNGCGGIDGKYLKDGDLVEVTIDQIGTLSHKIKFL